MANLPAELLYMVIDHASNRGSHVPTLCNFSLVSRQWYAAVHGRLYGRWSYDGEQHSISSLWQFLRSVLSNRRIADSVQELDIRNWTFGLVHGRRRFALSEDDIDLIRNAIRTAGLERIEASVLEALPKADPRPLMALLLANLRNLTTLYAQLANTDIFLTELLRKALESARDQPPNDGPLHSLREAHLTASWNYVDRRLASWNRLDPHQLGLSHLWPVFQLPSIQKLSVFDLDLLGASTLFENSAKTSSITDLTLVCTSINLTAVSDVSALLCLPKVLTRLSFCLNDCVFPEDDRKHISNTDLWNGIRQHQDSLEYLDVYRDCCVSPYAPPRYSADNAYFGSMRGFKRLKQLCIQAEVLLGACCGSHVAPFPLKDTLPPDLQSLTFYSDEGLAVQKTLGQQLQDVIQDTTNFPGLGHIALEGTLDAVRRHRCRTTPPHAEAERACKQRGIEYETKPESSCDKGGIGLPYYRHLRNKRLQNRPKRTGIKSAMTRYLLRLQAQGPLDGGQDPTMNDWWELSSEYLDTYELPWDELYAKEER